MNILKKKKLVNGITITICDQSRQIAGDRWHLCLACKASMPFNNDFESVNPDGDTEELRAEIRQRMGNELIFTLTKERNFVSIDQKEGTMQEMLRQVLEHVTSYLASDKFPVRLYGSLYNKYRSECLSSGAIAVDGREEEESGPADFSDCFLD